MDAVAYGSHHHAQGRVRDLYPEGDTPRLRRETYRWSRSRQREWP